MRRLRSVRFFSKCCECVPIHLDLGHPASSEKDGMKLDDTGRSSAIPGAARYLPTPIRPASHSTLQIYSSIFLRSKIHLSRGSSRPIRVPASTAPRNSSHQIPHRVRSCRCDRKVLLDSDRRAVAGPPSLFRWISEAGEKSGIAEWSRRGDCNAPEPALERGRLVLEGASAETRASRDRVSDLPRSKPLALVLEENEERTLA